MDNPVLKTSADDLYELVKKKKKISVEDAAKLLKIPVNVIQGLVDFLVEEKIFGMEYKFTTPYIYIGQEKKENTVIQNKLAKKLMTKDEFFKKAGNWDVPMEKINDLWKRYVEENISTLKENFYIKANSRNIPKDETDNLWKKYLAYIM